MQDSRSNSESELERLTQEYTESLERARRGGLKSLEDFRKAGAALRQMKALLPRGRFGPEIERRCRCTRQWAARLMKLDLEWDDVLAAFRWAESNGQTLDRCAYSVDGALRLVKTYCESRNRNTTRTRRRPSRKTAAALQAELVTVKRERATAKGYAAFLEEKLAELRERLAEFDPKDWNPSPRPLDDVTRDKVRKVAALWDRPGTDGEQESAATRIYVIADRIGWSFEDLLAACGCRM
jgi:hypothetical protein